MEKDANPELLKRVSSIEKSLQTMNLYLSKQFHYIPESVIQSLVSIRSSLLRGDFSLAEEQYLNMDVGSMVPENHQYWDLKMSVSDLSQMLVVGVLLSNSWIEREATDDVFPYDDGSLSCLLQQTLHLLRLPRKPPLFPPLPPLPPRFPRFCCRFFSIR